MSKLSSDERKARIKSLEISLRCEIQCRDNHINVYSYEFLDRMREFIFETAEKKEETLNTFMHLINCYKYLKTAVYLKYEGPTTYESIPLEQSIARGSDHPFAEEFENDEGIFPNWYLQSKIRNNDSDCSQ